VDSQFLGIRIKSVTALVSPLGQICHLLRLGFKGIQFQFSAASNNSVFTHGVSPECVMPRRAGASLFLETDIIALGHGR